MAVAKQCAEMPENVIVVRAGQVDELVELRSTPAADALAAIDRALTARRN